MRVKCDSLGLLCEDYVAHDTVENKDEVFTGLSKYLVDEQVVDNFYAGEDIKGLTSGAVFSVVNFDDDTNDKYNEGDIFESEADLLIDFSESNPFGSF